MITLSRWLSRVSSAPVALAGLILFILFTATVLPDQAAQAERYSAGLGSPDASLIYSPATLYDFAEAYGAEGRAAFIRARFTFDVVWPLVYTVFLATAISWVAGKAFAPTSRWQRLNLVPVVGMILDVLENSATSTVMWRFPSRTPVIEWLAPLFTALKWLFVNGSFVVLSVLLVIAVWRLLRQRVIAAG
ncbi:MAG: hypothetical protein KDD73_02940 [Anaerolineales bacterium]|nr:hypothetical protein [Anaerolineales bacterium]